MTSVMTTVSIDLWVLLVGVVLPSACLLVISLVYCWRRLARRRSIRPAGETGHPDFNQLMQLQMQLEMVLQQTDNAFNSIVDAVREQRVQLLKVLETHQLSTPAADGQRQRSEAVTPKEIAAATAKATDERSSENDGPAAADLGPAADGTATLFDPYSQIPGHIRRGLTVPEVAARLDLPESAVELYVNLRMSAA